MLPDYPLVKHEIEKKINLQFQKRAETQSFILSRVKPIVLHEGTNTRLIRTDGSVDDTPMKRGHAEVEISNDDAVGGPVEDMVGKFICAAEDIGLQMQQHFFEKINQDIDAVGNTFNLNGRSLTPEIILEMLDRLLVDFDDYGNPKWPELVASSKNRKSIETVLRQFEEDPVYQRKMQQLIQRKYGEYRDRESNRRLVD